MAETGVAEEKPIGLSTNDGISKGPNIAMFHGYEEYNPVETYWLFMAVNLMESPTVPTQHWSIAVLQ